LKKPTLSYEIVGAAVAVVTISGMMMYSTMLLSTTVYAQPAGRRDTAMSFGDASPEAKNLAITIAAGQLWNLTLTNPSITFSEDGSLSISDTLQTAQGPKILMIMVQHNLTPENGYVYDNGIITAPNGTRVFP
jgi:hypothetical protein